MQRVFPLPSKERLWCIPSVSVSRYASAKRRTSATSHLGSTPYMLGASETSPRCPIQTDATALPAPYYFNAGWPGWSSRTHNVCTELCWSSLEFMSIKKSGLRIRFLVAFQE